MFLSKGMAKSKLKICLSLFAVLIAGKVQAEGSKEISSNGGNRAFLVSATTVTASFLFPTLGTMKVYAKAGETINVGSSVQGNGLGTINMRAPNGNTYTSGSSTTIGLIANRAQELAGPLPNAGGYTPYTRTVQAGEDGVWEVDFVAQNGGLPSENPVPIAANASWTQYSGQYIAAFDITVRSAANAPITGRVYTNIFSGILGSFDTGFNGIFKILTKDGYAYTLDNNGQAGNGFSFFVNNKGFRNAGGDASYQSINNLDKPNIQDPRAADTQSDVTYKIFFNDPAADLPATAPVPGGGTTWLHNAIAQPAITQSGFQGIEGTLNRAGTSPLQSVFTFTVNKNGGYTILIDVDQNGSFADPKDRKLTGTVSEGPNQVIWDGLDGQGAKVPAGNYNATINVVLFGGEVHFPFFDVERNVNGIKLTRTNGNLAPDFTVYWDDSSISTVGTPSSPVKNITGLNSQINGHKWGSPGALPSDFGDERGLDTWAYIASTNLSAAVPIQLQEADLQLSDINANSGGGCVGQLVNYVFTARNNGPNAVSGSKLSFAFPADLTNVQVTHTPTGGTVAFSAETTNNGVYSVSLDLTSGAAAQFVVTGRVPKMPASGSVTVTAGIMRPADVTDPDATNPDAAAPNDAQVECDSAPSGTGCNNVKTNVLAFIMPPDAGNDQTVFINETATLTAVGAGTWAQLGNAPAVAAITTPTALKTEVTGLSVVGKYAFLRTNTAGCTDTAFVTVLPKKIDIPTVITPNGDGKNDTFTIPNIELFPGSQLIIVNRWGNEVYRSDSYQNTWTGEGLSEGTYYYVLNRKEPNGGHTTFKGWLFLKR
ncbi:gliding motility-associated-like protein [Mucilaginibacter yixingensis]|uniref:Gliding motility-associated-like protein n=1 Tax=Mucilaginibacter yixingensis TaxID=1295612 RepID=A0A2T5J4Z0_9SPHI|nr:gliding motility-associated C-terminal domain-containing protein [Mucilaginibacter yixingensis]PTQ92666.1 gliding motility-associated-like protein [Mucilaginibacter yixingensis]